jgi:hypothetical protein
MSEPSTPVPRLTVHAVSTAKRRDKDRAKDKEGGAKGKMSLKQHVERLKPELVDALVRMLVKPIEAEENCGALEDDYFQTLCQPGAETDDESALADALSEMEVHRVLAKVLIKSERKRVRRRSLTGQQRGNEKFQAEAETMVYGKLSTFENGLERLVGLPSPNLTETMEREHCKGPDAGDSFVVKNYGTETTSQKEYSLTT